MKKLAFLIIGFFTMKAYCQNEFAASAFYTDFKKIYEDAKGGFVTYKGDKRNSEFEELASEYKVKLLLPLADSGKIVYPVSGNNPFVVFYFLYDAEQFCLCTGEKNNRCNIRSKIGGPRSWSHCSS